MIFLMKMNDIKEFKTQFVEYMPNDIMHGILYISMKYSVAIHLCACGCGEKVVTPFSSSDWQLKYDGESISLYPSIGNWDFPCQSHYWIKKNNVVHAERWRDEEKLTYTKNTSVETKTNKSERVLNVIFKIIFYRVFKK